MFENSKIENCAKIIFCDRRVMWICTFIKQIEIHSIRLLTKNGIDDESIYDDLSINLKFVFNVSNAMTSLYVMNQLPLAVGRDLNYSSLLFLILKFSFYKSYEKVNRNRLGL